MPEGLGAGSFVVVTGSYSHSPSTRAGVRWQRVTHVIDSLSAGLQSATQYNGRLALVVRDVGRRVLLQLAAGGKQISVGRSCAVETGLDFLAVQGWLRLYTKTILRSDVVDAGVPQTVSARCRLHLARRSAVGLALYFAGFFRGSVLEVHPDRTLTLDGTSGTRDFEASHRVAVGCTVLQRAAFACVRACKRACRRVHVHVRVCVRVRVRACVCVRVCLCVRACLRAFASAGRVRVRDCVLLEPLGNFPRVSLRKTTCTVLRWRGAAKLDANGEPARPAQPRRRRQPRRPCELAVLRVEASRSDPPGRRHRACCRAWACTRQCGRDRRCRWLR